LTARGVCLRHGRSISYAEARVFDAKEQLIAHGTSTLMALRGKGLDLQVSKFLEK
jgi:acyl-coenzyme A thioesterase PaaI-like protein